MFSFLAVQDATSEQAIVAYSLHSCATHLKRTNPKKSSFVFLLVKRVCVVQREDDTVFVADYLPCHGIMRMQLLCREKY